MSKADPDAELTRKMAKPEPVKQMDNLGAAVDTVAKEAPVSDEQRSDALKEDAVKPGQDGAKSP